MKIDYYKIRWDCQSIIDWCVDSESDDCVSYSLDSVTVKEVYQDSRDETVEETATYPRSFEVAKKELAEFFRKAAADYQQKLTNLENSADYERYCAVKFL